MIAAPASPPTAHLLPPASPAAADALPWEVPALALPATPAAAPATRTAPLDEAGGLWATHYGSLGGAVGLEFTGPGGARVTHVFPPAAARALRDFLNTCPLEGA